MIGVHGAVVPIPAGARLPFRAGRLSGLARASWIMLLEPCFLDHASWIMLEVTHLGPFRDSRQVMSQVATMESLLREERVGGGKGGAMEWLDKAQRIVLRRDKRRTKGCGVF